LRNGKPAAIRIARGIASPALADLPPTLLVDDAREVRVEAAERLGARKARDTAAEDRNAARAIVAELDAQPRVIAVTFSSLPQERIPEYWIASMAMVQYEGTSEVMKSATDRSPARIPASPESNPVPNRLSNPVITKSGASEAKSAS